MKLQKILIYFAEGLRMRRTNGAPHIRFVQQQLNPSEDTSAPTTGRRGQHCLVRVANDINRI